MRTLVSNFRNYLAYFWLRIPWKKVMLLFGVIMVVGWFSLTPEGLLGKADAIGYAVCHRINLRSFHLGDRQLPLCARCTGQYLGAVMSLVFLGIARPRRTGRPPWIIIGVLVLFAGIYALDGLNSYIHLIPQLSRFYLYEPRNILRILTGIGLGLGMGILVFAAFNETVWKKNNSRPVIEGYKDFGILLLVAAAVNLMVISENPIVLYPFALISAGGVLILLTMIYTMVVIMVLKVENTYEDMRQLRILLAAGFFIALGQIALLDLLRYLLTGSWDGFHLG